jgi:putative Mg2+ transporter-C (MgtC) family protein
MLEQFVDPTNVMFAKLFLAIFLGAVLGTERSVIAGQPAGTRTFGLVSLGACLFMIIAQHHDNSYIGIVNFDPMHVAVGIITGIGFIGGGLIIFRNESLHGVTTAAGLWVATAVGMSVGVGMYAVGIFTTLLTLLMFTGAWYLENRFKHWFRAYNDTIPESNN